MDLGLAGATSVIVGGTRGIGLASALCLAGEGCRVGILGRDAGQLEQSARLLAAAGSPEVLTLTADVASGAEVQAAFESVGARWGELNTLINAVGPGSAGSFGELDDTDWTAAFDLGVMSAVRCVR